MSDGLRQRHGRQAAESALPPLGRCRRPGGAAADGQRGLRKLLPGAARPARRRQRRRCARSTASPSPCSRARRWASSANSGCGKSTTARLLMHLIEPDERRDRLRRRRGRRPTALSLQELRRQVQMVFQDSYASLNPRLTDRGLDRLRPARARRRRPTAMRRARAICSARVGLDPTASRALSARAVGRPAPARQHRARAGARRRACDPRRGRLGARQIGRGAGAEPAASI